MSARTRGIVLQQEGEALVIQATAAEVQQFTRGASVTVDAHDPRIIEPRNKYAGLGPRLDDNWRLDVGPPLGPYDDRFWDARKCVARLKTKCGCEQTRVVPHPAPETIRVALCDARDMALKPDMVFDSLVSYTVREFVCRGRYPDPEEKRWYYLYEEK